MAARSICLCVSPVFSDVIVCRVWCRHGGVPGGKELTPATPMCFYCGLWLVCLPLGALSECENKDSCNVPTKRCFRPFKDPNVEQLFQNDKIILRTVENRMVQKPQSHLEETQIY